MAPSAFYVSILAALTTSAASASLFQSRDAVVRSHIETCNKKLPEGGAGGQCYLFLSCILESIPPDYQARWSAGASILAFIPTIAGLMSNSVQEVGAVAEESVVLACLLCTSSVTAFSSRFEDVDTNRMRNPGNKRSFDIESALEDVAELIETNQSSDSTLWRDTKLQNLCAAFFLLALSAGLWYEIYQVSRYGILTFACRVKFNVGLWTGLTQLLGVVNIIWRHYIFDVRKVYLRSRTLPRGKSSSQRVSIGLDHTTNQPVSPRPTSGSSKILALLDNGSVGDVTLVLRSPRSRPIRWFLQTMVGIFSYALYAFGTVVLASITMIPASDAIRVTVILATGAGFGRLVGYWSVSPSRTGRKVILMDVPAAHLDELARRIPT